MWKMWYHRFLQLFHLSPITGHKTILSKMALFRCSLWHIAEDNVTLNYRLICWFTCKYTHLNNQWPLYKKQNVLFILKLKIYIYIEICLYTWSLDLKCSRNCRRFSIHCWVAVFWAPELPEGPCFYACTGVRNESHRFLSSFSEGQGNFCKHLCLVIRSISWLFVIPTNVTFFLSTRFMDYWKITNKFLKTSIDKRRSYLIWQVYFRSHATVQLLPHGWHDIFP